jgi:hypothetical protein
MLRCWRRGGCRRPKNTAKMGVALHRAHRQAGRQCGESHVAIVVYSPPPLPAAAVQQIVFESCLVKDVGNDCLMSINGTDFQIMQKGHATKGNTFASHKYAGKSALQYELRIDILAGNLVWVSGPYPAGKWNDINFFLNELAHCL